MCGIAGFVGGGDKIVLERMTELLVHRGPDDDGFLVDADHGVHLGFRRLSILDRTGGHQPMTTKDGLLTVIFNGQIYNFRELREVLVRQGFRFQTDHSDTEVLLHGYRHWGKELPSQLNGMWAFVIYDPIKRELFCSRDRFGKKPFFYFLSKDTFVFASELIALRAHPRVPRELSPKALQKYFAYGFVPAPLTFLEGVNKLPGGHSLTLDLATLNPRTERYWQYQLDISDTIPADAENAWAEELSAKLDAAVKRRLIADVPVGTFLSGGIDSSSVSALAIRHIGADRLKTFSIGFDEASFDESCYARQVAQHIGAEHHLDTLSIDRALDILPDVVARWDEPIADASILPTYLLCQHARRHVTVALGGDGADELFGGYDPFKALRYAKWYSRLMPKPLHRAISLIAAKLPVSHRYMSFDFKLKRTLRGLDFAPHLWMPVWMSPLSPNEVSELFRTPVNLEEVYSEAIEIWDGCVSSDLVDRTIAFYVNLYLQEDILVKVDRASMLHSLQVHAPFLDIELVDFVRRIPAHYKSQGSRTKILLKKAMERFLPHDILYRRKQGFGVPIGKWFADATLPRQPTNAIVNQTFWQSKLAEHRSNRQDQRAYLWSDWLFSNSFRGMKFPQHA